MNNPTRPSLSKILRAILHVKNIDWATWKQIRSTRKGETIMILQAVSAIARQYGYRYVTIASYIQRDRTTVIHHIDNFNTRIQIYPDYKELYEKAMEILTYQHSHTMQAYLARCKTGALIIAQNLPERSGDYWFADCARIFDDQQAFPQITWEKEPVKVNITVTVEEYEGM